MTDLYEVLGVTRDATLKDIKTAYRKKSKEYHPDTSGDHETMASINEAYDILSDPTKRARYDKTGRTDESPTTPEKVRNYINQTMNIVIEATRKDGSTDDPCWENILDKMILSLMASRTALANSINDANRRLSRTRQLLKRFKLKKAAIEGFDPVGDALKNEASRLERELRGFQDALELSLEVERHLKGYDYEVGPDAEGQSTPGPTRRPQFVLGGPRFNFSS